MLSLTKCFVFVNLSCFCFVQRQHVWSNSYKHGSANYLFIWFIHITPAPKIHSNNRNRKDFDKCLHSQIKCAIKEK